ncbi:tripartite tricarboxylate transporter substrate binding protein [Alicycliphilus denitrificans]|jgi:tripartite-type tricarboxylate transporter receptor subunit TctC|uniref:Tripartite tricarboxylate transporter substrate binding protein n=1 Tax=Alicycliphilus denitrificans TaxID=179636 RepID=A0A858ZRT0_9BURK|nr:tripartite tricarboxylate transporter substrate binding protein [Alicycliphilus denitrificans]QKD43566.1 tripartite tricarboxylate transporter substrate binding protein [Alicycliphilus denitrificans]
MKNGHRFANSRRRIVKAIACGLTLSPFLAAPAYADWPSDKVIRIIVPFAAGGATDLLGRALAVELGKSLKQSVIVENRAGAGGSLGAQAVAISPADGYTLLLASGSMFTVNQYIYSKLPYSLDDFAPITKIASGPMVITVNATLPVKTTKELIEYAKARPGKLSFSSAGVGSQTHMAGEAFTDAAGIELVHVPYKGEGPAYADLMAGVIEVAAANINAISPLLKGGRLRALSVTGKERSPLLPNVPTTAEDGVPGFEFTGWFALMAPKGTPQPAIDRLLAESKVAVEQPSMKRYFADQGMYATIAPSAQLKDEIVKESAKWKALVEKKKITAN